MLLGFGGDPVAKLTRFTRRYRQFVASSLVLVLAGCSTQSQAPAVREASGSDPIAGVFAHCQNLLGKEDSSSTCEFAEDRGNAGADIVSERILCVQDGQFVQCKARPGEGPGPEEYWLDFRCSRTDVTCQITSGAPSYVEAFAPLFESHNRIVLSTAATKNANQ